MWKVRKGIKVSLWAFFVLHLYFFALSCGLCLKNRYICRVFKLNP